MKATALTHSDSGWWWAVTADQRHSRRSPDLVPDALALLSDLGELAAERSTGDELQVAGRSAEDLLTVLERLIRAEDWRIGVGFGPIEVAASVRESRGPAFIAARDAIEAAPSTAAGIAFASPAGVVGATQYARGDEPREAGVARAHATVVMLQHVWSKRGKEGWDVVDAMADGLTGRESAERLGISPSAVSQRLRTAGWQASLLGSGLFVDVVSEVLA